MTDYAEPYYVEPYYTDVGEGGTTVEDGDIIQSIAGDGGIAGPGGIAGRSGGIAG